MQLIREPDELRHKEVNHMYKLYSKKDREVTIAEEINIGIAVALTLLMTIGGIYLL